MNERLCFAALSSMVWLAASAASADSPQRRIAIERGQADTAFVEQQRACRERFVVAPCLEAARKEHQVTLTRLHKEEVQEGEAKRRAAAAARSRSLRDKAAAQQERASAARGGSSEDGDRDELPRKAPAITRSRADGAASKPAEGRSDEAKRALERKNEAQFEARARAARAHRETVERRNAERAADARRPMPLPVPSGASAP